jgi:hypothetical protein
MIFLLNILNMDGTYYICIVGLPFNCIYFKSTHLNKHDKLTCVKTRV